MKILNKTLFLQLLIIKLVFGRPINYEELEKKSSERVEKPTWSDYLKVQSDVHQGREELTAFNQFDETSDDILINQPVVNKFNSIHRYHKGHQPDIKNKVKIPTESNHDKPDFEYIPDHYIVLFKEDIEDVVISQHMDKINSMIRIQNDDHKTNFEIKHFYNMDGFKGYHGTFDESTVKLIKQTSEVLMVERDQKIRINTNLNVQANAPWNLSRISRRQLTENEVNKEKYLYQHSSGQNVTVYVIDTGINIHHVEFGGRAKWGATFGDEIEEEDFNGHGTHVAGIIGGSIYGVAKKVNLVAVKVINKDGEGSLSDVIQGIEFSISDHLRRYNINTSEYPVRSVINFSLGGPLSNILNRAAETAINYGINMVTAAGNDHEDSCYSSPASSPKVITVAATNDKDEITEYSNNGNCVTVFAPGDTIESAWTGATNNLINVSSGTSMACPHVAGVVALLLDTEQYARYKPDQVLKLVEDLSTKNIVKKIPIWSNTPNRLLYSSPPVKGTKFADNDKTNDNDPDNLDDIIDDDDKPDDLNDIIDDDDDKNKGDDGVGDIIDDDDDKPDDLDDIIDDDDDQNKGNDGIGDIIDDDDDDDDQNKGNDGIGDIIDDDDDDGDGKPDDLNDIIDDDDQNKGDDGVGDIIDDDDDQNKGNDGIGDIIDDDDDDGKPDDLDDIVDDDDQNKGDDGVGDIIDDDDDQNKGNDGIGDIIDDDDDDQPDDLDDIIDDDNGNDKNKSGDLDKIEDGENDNNNGDNDDLNDIIDDDDDDTPDDINDIVENSYSIFKNLFINRQDNHGDNTVKIKKPLRKDKTYITYYLYKQIKKEFNLED